MATKKEDSSKKVPYFLVHQPDHQTKVLFQVPSRLALSIVKHPILCRGAAFDLQMDASSTSSFESSNSQFVFTQFTSPTPEVTAEAISMRLAVRIASGSCGGNPVLSSIFGI